MNLEIWKFPIPFNIPNPIPMSMPRDAQILHADVQNDEPMVWAMVDTKAPSVTHHVSMFGTGHNIRFDPGRHVGSFLVEGGTYVFHVFDGGEL